jgi:HSP20 family protein
MRCLKRAPVTHSMNRRPHRLHGRLPKGDKTMLTRFADFDTTFGIFDELRRRMDRLWDDFEPAWSETPGWAASSLAASSWPSVNLYDSGAKLVVVAEVPGMNDKNIQVTLSNDTLSISGERKTETPEGYSVHRRERGSVQFSRSFALPSKVDGERIVASVKDGVLTITLPKAAEAQPRQIAVKSN